MLEPFPASVILREPGRARYVKVVVKAGCLDKNRGRADRLEDLFLRLWKRTGDEAYLCLRPNFFVALRKAREALQPTTPASKTRDAAPAAANARHDRVKLQFISFRIRSELQEMNYKPGEQQRVTRLQRGGQTHAN